MKGQRVVYPSQAKVEVEAFEIPTLGGNDVLVGTECTLLSPGTERAGLLGLPNTGRRYPSYPGYCNVGKIIELGAEVEGFAIGDCVASTRGHMSHFVAPSENLIKITDAALSSEEATFFQMCAISLQAVRKARIELGEPVLVLGQGLIGLFAMQLARLCGGFPVIGADLADSRLKCAEEVGADYTLNLEASDCEQRIAEMTQGKGLAVVIEATGHPEPINTAFKLAGWCGRVILLASTRGETKNVNFYRDVHKKGLTVFGAHNSVRPPRDSSANFWTARADLELSLQLITLHRVVVAPLITHRFPGTDAAKAYQQLMEWDENLLGVVLNWGEN
jgi:2-desacetyl-2-hydroxyethyl bacteriochlorophyllide A dehydrogenase